MRHSSGGAADSSLVQVMVDAQLQAVVRHDPLVVVPRAFSCIIVVEDSTGVVGRLPVPEHHTLPRIENRVDDALKDVVVVGVPQPPLHVDETVV